MADDEEDEADEKRIKAALDAANLAVYLNNIKLAAMAIEQMRIAQEQQAEHLRRKKRKKKTMDIKTLASMVMAKTGNAGLVVQKFSPEILLGAGLLSGIATIIMASSATLKVNTILQQADVDSDRCHIALDRGETDAGEPYTQEDFNTDVSTVQLQKVVGVAKLYVPTMIMGAITTGCILASHNIISKRNVGLMAAYKLVSDSYNSYRERTREALGDDGEEMIRFGGRKEEIVEHGVDETGKKTKTKKEVVTFDHNISTDYSKFFDQMSPMFKRAASDNYLFLTNQQNYANDLLHTKGHIFLNEVYDMLGIPRTPVGALVGWVKNSKVGDNCVDFGLKNNDSKSVREFVNGYERAVLLDFNVDGVIYDLL